MMCLYDKPCSLWHYKHKIYDKKRKLQEIIDEHLVEEEGGASAAAAELLEAEEMLAAQLAANSLLPVAVRVQQAKEDFNKLHND